MSSRLPKAVRSPTVVALVVGLLVSLFVLGVRLSGHLQRSELLAYDWFLKLRPLPAESDSRVTVLGITEQDIQQLGRWPPTDEMLQRVLEQILSAGPRAVGVDLYRDLPVPPGEARLEATLKRHPNIVVVMKFGKDAQTRVEAPAVLRGTEQVGFNDFLVDDDGVVRRGLLFLDDGQEVAYAFGLRLALQFLQPEGVTPQPDPVAPENLRLGRTTFHPLSPFDGGYAGVDARGYQMLLDYQAGRRSFATYSLGELFSGHIPADRIKDKVVLIGVTAVSLPDVFNTPYTATFVGEQHGTYGVLVHAETVSQYLRAALDGDRMLGIVPEPVEATWIVLWGMAGGLAGLVGHTLVRFLLVAVGGLVLLVAVAFGTFMSGWWWPVVSPASSWLFAAALVTAYMTNQEKRQRAMVMQLFSRHVSPEIAEAIWRERDQFWEGGRPRSQQAIITVLFTDLEGFTAVSEKMTPQDLMDWTNVYIDTMAQVVMRHQGVVDDYYGDAIKANFGVPFPRSSEEDIRADAINAVECALEMSRSMLRLNEQWQQQGLPRVRMRIGIYTGQAVAGSLGTAQRLKYTTIGDTVNIAARLESYDKESWGPASDSACRIFIGESTRRHLDDMYRLQRVGELALKGKIEKVNVYHVLGHTQSSVSGLEREAR